METLLRRTVLTRNQLVARKRKDTAKKLRKDWREFNRTKNVQNTEIQHIIRDERLARRQDWMMGPLAPKRDAGLSSRTFGAVDNQVLAQGAQLPSRECRGPKGPGYSAIGHEDKRLPGSASGEWSGEGLVGNLLAGDRVVVVKGRLGLQGKIGEVSRVDENSNTVTIKGVNKVDMKVPAQSFNVARGQKVFEQELPIPIADVRLVHSPINPKTGQKEDVIVRHVYGGYPWTQRTLGQNTPRHTRYIKGLVDPSTGKDMIINWPEDEPERFYTQSCDTPRDLVEELTYQPVMRYEVPLPESVVDELRVKHARTRRDWDDLDFMRKKLVEDARRDWFAERSKVLSEPFWTKEFMLRQKKVEQQKLLER